MRKTTKIFIKIIGILLVFFLNIDTTFMESEENFFSEKENTKLSSKIFGISLLENYLNNENIKNLVKDQTDFEELILKIIDEIKKQ